VRGLNSLSRERGVSAPMLLSKLSKLYRRKLNLKAKLESVSSYCSFKRLVPGIVNVGLTGSTCTTLPSTAATPCTADATRGAGWGGPRCRALQSYFFAAQLEHL